MSNIEGKMVWITGASSGIGEAVAKEYNKRGAKIIISARRESELERVKSECNNSYSVEILPLDLAKADSLQNKSEQALSLFGRIDVLLHCGGISQRAMAMETSLDIDRQIMEVNYFGTIAITKAIVPSMLENGGGHIGVITSLMGIFSSPFRSGYAASKHALHGFFDALRAENHDKGLKVTLLVPGFINTPISMNALDPSGERLNQMDDAQANGISAEDCARRIYYAMRKRKLEVYIGRKEILGIYLKRYFPKLLAKVIRKAKVR